MTSDLKLKAGQGSDMTFTCKGSHCDRGGVVLHNVSFRMSIDLSWIM